MRGVVAALLVLTGCAGAGPEGTDAGPTDAGALDAGRVAPDAGPLPEASVTAVSLNLRCLLDDWDRRLPIIARDLAGLDPDVLGLQEACAGEGRDNVAELVAALEARTGRTYAVHRRVTHRAWDRYDEGLALLVALPVEDSREVALPAGTFGRAMLLARVTGPFGALVFGTTHFDHQDGRTRQRQAEAAVAALSDFAGPTTPALLTGDFNSPPNGAVKPVFEGAGYVDVWAELHPEDPGPTFPAQNPTSRIDYLWIAGASPFAIARILTEPEGGVTASDHVGLFGAITR